VNLDERIAKAREDLAKAKAAFTDEDREFMQKRRELAAIEEEREEEERARREASLEKRLAATAEALGDEALFEGLMINSFPDTFIIVRNGKAHAAWMDATTRSHAGGGKPADRTSIHRAYAMKCIRDWNGIVFDDDVHPDQTRKLEKFLTENPGIVTPITDVAVRLAGVFADARSKSG
jgi:hypothetical protein